MFVIACEPAQVTETNGMSQETLASTIVSETTLVEPVSLRIRLVTTSDWTTLFLISGATWMQDGQIEADEEATTAELSEDQIILNQPIDHAMEGESVEMTVEVLFTAENNEESVVFIIERGDIGATQVEFSRVIDEKWTVIKTISWGEITGDGKNIYYVEVPTEELFGETPASSALSTEETTAPTAPITGMPQGTDGYPWWNDAIFYEIYVRSFYDSDGDGIGDLNGIAQKLDYLNDGDPATSNDLGITGIWLMPIFPSPTQHGYNAIDYYSINPDYGTMNDLNNLIDAAHARGIRVILDLTLNQTSYQHPWFIQSCDPSSPYRDWYIWSDHDPDYSGYWGQQVWFPYNGDFYYSTFSAYSPDLNHNNPDVKAEMLNVVRFWLEDVGVDGFRLDAAKHLIEEGENQANTTSTHAWWESFRPFYKSINPQAVTVGEIWDKTAIMAEYLQGDEFDLSFEFYLAGAFISSVNEGAAGDTNYQIEVSNSFIPMLRYAVFLTNHDQDRTMSQLFNDPEKAKVAASLMLTSPGVPFLYYGEELGMQGNVPDDQNRLPMQWSVDQFAGFTTVSPWKPLGTSWERYNVAMETNDPASILSHYRDLIQERNQHAALRVGNLSILATGNNSLYGILRVSQQEALLVLINLSREPVTEFALSLEQSGLAEGSYMPVPIMGSGDFTSVLVNSMGGFSEYKPIAEIPPYATIILQLQPNVP